MNADKELMFNDLLKKNDIDPSSVAILRHSFSDPGKHRTLLRVASECPELFDAFQSVQDATVEGAMERLNDKGFVAAFVESSPGKALFVGLFRVAGSVPMRPDDIYALPSYEELDVIGRGYVGSAYGDDNLLGRWKDYAATGHGGNKLLRARKPDNFRYSILERLSPDARPELVIQAESSWKVRLCTRGPHGLNDN